MSKNFVKVNDNLERQIRDKGFILEEDEKNYKRYYDQGNDNYIVFKRDTEGRWSSGEAEYDSETKEYDEICLRFDEPLDKLKIHAFDLKPVSNSKRKTPITFRRGSTKSPVASSTRGPGKGWHGETVRHSKASIKGWRGRK